MKAKLNLIEFAFVAFILVVFLSPYFNVLIPGQYILGLEILYTAFIFIFDVNKRKLCLAIIIGALLIALLYVFTTDIRTISSPVNRTLKGFYSFSNQYLTMFFPVVVFTRVKERANLFQKVFLLSISFSLLLYTVYNTILALNYNPMLMKSQMEADLSSDDPITGGYFYVIASPIWVTSLFYCFYKVKNILFRCLSIAIGLFFLYYVSYSGYTIAFLASLLGCYLCVYFERRRMFSALHIIIPVFVILAAVPLLQLLIRLMPQDSPAIVRLEEMIFMSQSNSVAGTDAGSRFYLYGKGLLKFLSSPIWGNYTLNFNPHSTFVEVLASLGLLGGTVLYKQIKHSFKAISTYDIGFSFLPIFSVYIFQGALNPVNASLSLAVSCWLLAPLLFDVVNEFIRRSSKYECNAE